MKKLAFTTAIALALATTAYAQDHHGGMRGGEGGGAGVSAHGSSTGGGGGGSSPGFSAQRAPGGTTNDMGTARGNSGLFNRAPTNQNVDRDRDHFSDRNRNSFSDRDHDRFSDHDRRVFNRSDRDRDFDHNRDRFSDRDRGSFNHNERDRGFDRDRDFQHRGIVRGNFFEHGRHFGFRRFFHGQVVFLTSFDDCTAWAWVHVAPGTWAWRPIDICIG